VEIDVPPSKTFLTVPLVCTFCNCPNQLYSSISSKTTREDALLFMLDVLPSAKNPNIDKFAILLRPIPENPQPWSNAKEKPKMIGLVGTNRMSDQGLETGYFFNKKYWGQGYATEAFAAFLKLYWSLPGMWHIITEQACSDHLRNRKTEYTAFGGES